MNFHANQGLWKDGEIVLRSTVFALIQFVSTIAFGLLCQLTWPLPFPARHWFTTLWVHFNLWCLAKVCSLTYRIEGKENIPATPGVVLCKHESAWETLVLQAIFQPQVWVLKRELMWIPFLGWALAVLRPIAIDRTSTHRALTQVVRQGHNRLEAGIWVTMFPEGTRVAPGETENYFSGGALLAKRSGRDALPVAHNAGDFWPRRGFIKKPGTIHMVIGPKIESKGRSAVEINTLAKEWIESTVKRIRN
uniref:1-acyl-sn-glycerol-3-phosphate acyltransferase n=1 Tax=Candidatus Kentrum eta TaxID=2126337 RepID=A0A450VEQ8_9GAMM|nr:MAG: 1-acyl-sn-glycerol-3-phosphate acyltransferase [Candidatus Kentron sp. H]VFK03293.1 MAG: 1-acyl-sn-glycerol-3-phosphate acyltransferase [Candidatus Kentron sp. H]VFK06070.1 MAG: 1-acyl-sn-glycerol-3-phosphate acyltransferase [Candidatus Kentron sp. H]